MNNVTTVLEQVAETMNLAGADEALAFERDLTQFLEAAKSKADLSSRIRAEIAEKQAEVEAARFEIDLLSANRPRLAQTLAQLTEACDEAHVQYQQNELGIASWENSIELRRADLFSLRKHLRSLEEHNN